MHADSAEASSTQARRAFLIRIIQSIHAVMGATLAFIVGGAVVAPSFTRRHRTWLPATDLSSLDDGTPHTVSLRVPRADGATETIDRRTVYLLRSGDSVRALDSTCTHLGCRTRFNRESGRIECPCHGGLYDASGTVIGGPPPSPLQSLPARVEQGTVYVEV
jgi:menaquinol-cytochrome c reductase iron-sulfur subunit